jgi:hypothetical protein
MIGAWLYFEAVSCQGQSREVMDYALAQICFLTLSEKEMPISFCSASLYNSRTMLSSDDKLENC